MAENLILNVSGKPVTLVGVADNDQGYWVRSTFKPEKELARVGYRHDSRDEVLESVEASVLAHGVKGVDLVGLPQEQDGVFLIVELDVALEARSIGRTTEDLLIPCGLVFESIRSPMVKVFSRKFLHEIDLPKDYNFVGYEGFAFIEDDLVVRRG